MILDGHNRFRACNELGIKPKIQIFRFNNELEERKFIIDTNVKRRQLTDYQRYKYAQELKKIHAELKKQKQTKEAAEYGKLGGRGHKKEEKEKDQEENEKPLRTIVSKALATKKKTRREKTAAELAAEEVRWSHMTPHRAEKIETEGSEEEKKQFIEGKKTIWAISKDIEDRKKRQEIIKSVAIAAASASSNNDSSSIATSIKASQWITTPNAYKDENVVTAWGFQSKML